MYRESPSSMELVIRPNNIERAIKKVRNNNGSPSIDDMTVGKLNSHFREYYPQIREKLLNGTYEPQAVKKVAILKSDGKKRIFGISIARDRVIQQAIKQVIEPIIIRQLSGYSHDFRPDHSTGTALK